MNASFPLLLHLDGREIVADCGSTQDLCRIRAREGAPEGTVVQALAQTAGRGREARSWHSPPGLGLYVSILLRPRADSARWPALTPLLSLALAESLEELASSRPAAALKRWNTSIKWPNDLYGERGKLAGVLAETEGTAVVAGIGLNLAQVEGDFPPALSGRASSLVLEGFAPAPDAAAVLEALNHRLTRAYAAFQNGTMEFLREGLLRRFRLRGARVTVAAGGTLVQGTAVDLGGLGELILDTPGGRRSILAGEAVEVEPGPEVGP